MIVPKIKEVIDESTSLSFPTDVTYEETGVTYNQAAQQYGASYTNVNFKKPKGLQVRK